MATYSGSSLENSKDRGAWRTTVHGAAESPQVTVHGVTESRTQLNILVTVWAKYKEASIYLLKLEKCAQEITADEKRRRGGVQITSEEFCL